MLWSTLQILKIKSVGFRFGTKSGESAARLLDKLGAIVTVNDESRWGKSCQSLSEGISSNRWSPFGTLGWRVVNWWSKIPVFVTTILYSSESFGKENPGHHYKWSWPIWFQMPNYWDYGLNGKQRQRWLRKSWYGQVVKMVCFLGMWLSANDQVANNRNPKWYIGHGVVFPTHGHWSLSPRDCRITNLMPTHIDYHGSFWRIYAAKWTFKNMTNLTSCILNFNQTLAKRAGCKDKSDRCTISKRRFEKVDGAAI